MLAIQYAKELYRTSPCVIVRAVGLGTEGSIGKLPCQSVILFKRHIIGGIRNTRIVKYILIVEHHPEIASKGQFIQFSVHSHLIRDTAVLRQVHAVLCDIVIQRLQNSLVHQGGVSRNILDGRNIKIRTASRQLRSQNRLIIRGSQIHHLNLHTGVGRLKSVDQRLIVHGRRNIPNSPL